MWLGQGCLCAQPVATQPKWRGLRCCNLELEKQSLAAPQPRCKLAVARPCSGLQLHSDVAGQLISAEHAPTGSLEGISICVAGKLLLRSVERCDIIQRTLGLQQVRGLQRSGEHKARWEQLAGLAGGVLAQLLERAPRTPRNYILEDATKCAPAHGAGMRTRC